jgi:hypothetical protein
MRNYLNPVWRKHIEQAGADENLIEHVPVIVHVLIGVSIVCTGRLPVVLPKMSPHRIIEKLVVLALDRAELL